MFARACDLEGQLIAGHSGLGKNPVCHLDGWTRPSTQPAVVLDPLCGTGVTTLAVRVLSGVEIGVDLCLDYCRVARWRAFDRAVAAKTQARTWVQRQGGLVDGLGSGR